MTHGKTRAEKVIFASLTQDTRYEGDVSGTRVRETLEYVGHKLREAREHEEHKACEAQEHVEHKACEGRARRARGTVGTRSPKVRDT